MLFYYDLNIYLNGIIFYISGALDIDDERKILKFYSEAVWNTKLWLLIHLLQLFKWLIYKPHLFVSYEKSFQFDTVSN